MELQDTNAMENYETQDVAQEAAFAEGMAQAEEVDSLEKSPQQDTAPEDAFGDETGQQTKQDTQQQEQGTPTLKLKYLGREMELPQSEVVTLAQKGMNYDHLQSRLEQMEQSAEFAILDRYASMAGMSRGDYLQFLQQEAEKVELQPYVNKGMDEELAREYIGVRRKAEMMDGLQRTIEQKMQEQEQKRQEVDRNLMAFIQKYPEVKEFPAAVLADIRRGMTPLEAYAQHEAAELRNRLAATTQNERNRSSHAGSAMGTAAGEDGDVFLQGFLSAR